MTMTQARPLVSLSHPAIIGHCVDYTLGNLESKSIWIIPKFPGITIQVFYKMIIPGSTPATLSIIYTTRLYTSPPLPLLYPTYNNSIIICCCFTLPCRHHPLPRSLPATAVVCHCSTLLPIACHCPPPPSPNAIVCSRLPSHHQPLL